MSDVPEPPPVHRRKFLVVVDQTPECYVALRFAANRARNTGGLLALIFAISPSDVQQWAGIERMMRDEARTEAEGFIRKAAEYVYAITKTMPEIIIRVGRTAAEIRAVLTEDRSISILILALRKSAEGPGPLVEAIVGPESGGYPIPVTVVPGTLSDADVDALT